MIIEEIKKEWLEKQVIRLLKSYPDRQQIINILLKEIERREEIEKNESRR